MPIIVGRRLHTINCFVIVAKNIIKQRKIDSNMVQLALNFTAPFWCSESHIGLRWISFRALLQLPFRLPAPCENFQRILNNTLREIHKLNDLADRFQLICIELQSLVQSYLPGSAYCFPYLDLKGAFVVPGSSHKQIWPRNTRITVMKCTGNGTEVWPGNESNNHGHFRPH